MYILKLKYLNRHNLADFIFNCTRLLADANDEESYGIDVPLRYKPEIYEKPETDKEVKTDKGVKN